MPRVERSQSLSGGFLIIWFRTNLLGHGLGGAPLKLPNESFWAMKSLDIWQMGTTALRLKPCQFRAIARRVSLKFATEVCTDRTPAAAAAGRSVTHAISAFRLTSLNKQQFSLSSNGQSLHSTPYDTSSRREMMRRVAAQRAVQ